MMIRQEGGALPRGGVPPEQEGDVVVRRGRRGLGAFQDGGPEAVGGRRGGFHQAREWYAALLAGLEPDPEEVHFFDVRGAPGRRAVVPLRYEPARRRWCAPLHRHVNLFDAVADEGADGGVVLGAVLARLAAQRERPWDRVVLGRMPQEGVLGPALARGAVPLAMVRGDGYRAWFDLGAPSDPLAGAAGSFRRNLRRLERRLHSQGEVTLEIVAGPGQWPAAWQTFLHLEASGWKGPQGTASAIALQPEVRRFYEHLNSAWVPGGQCRIHLLHLDGRAIAAHLAVAVGDTLSLLKIAYDENAASLSPGYVLLYKLILHEQAQGRFRRISLVTDPPWAARWGPRREPLVRAVIFNTSARGFAGAGWERLKRARRRVLGRDDTLCCTGWRRGSGR